MTVAVESRVLPRPDDRTLIVAEIGNNHEGDVVLAERLIELAASAGADAVKFQCITPERLVAKSETRRLEQLRRICLPRESFMELADAARAHGVHFLCTPFDVDAVEFLDPHVAAFKIASGDNDFLQMIERTAQTGKPMLISTGLASIESMRMVVQRIRAIWGNETVRRWIALLHCVVQYPTPDESARLRRIGELESCDAVVGYSDHTLGGVAALASVALGAKVIEKHFTIDHEYSEYRDHQLSATPEEFVELVDSIRRLERMLQDRIDGSVMPEDGSAAVLVRRGAVAARDLPAGHVIGEHDVDWVRPCAGVAVREANRLIGYELCRGIRAGDRIELTDVRARIVFQDAATLNA